MEQGNEQDHNPLDEFEAVYFGDWDRAFKRAGNSGRAAMDQIRILLVMAGDLRRMRLVLEQQTAQKTAKR